MQTRKGLRACRRANDREEKGHTEPDGGELLATLRRVEGLQHRLHARVVAGHTWTIEGFVDRFHLVELVEVLGILQLICAERRHILLERDAELCVAGGA